MKRKLVITAVCALGALMILQSIFHFSNTQSTPAQDAQSAQVVALMEQAKQQASKLSEKEVLSNISLCEGAELGNILKQTYPNLKPSDIDIPLVQQGIADGIQNSLNPAYTGKPHTYTAACARILAAKMGSTIPDADNLSGEDKKRHDEITALIPQIPEDEALRHLYYTAGTLAAQAIEQQIPLCTLTDIDLQAFEKGLTTALNGETLPLLNDQAAYMAQGFAMSSLIDSRSAKQAQLNTEAGQKYLEANALKPGVITTPSGLQYRVISPGTGEIYNKTTHGDNPICTVTYEGRMVDGTIFDTTQDTPTSFPVRDVVPGFSEALKMMPVGAEWEITIPAAQAYGAMAPAIIGPNATLIFTVKLLAITPQKPH